MTTRSNKTGPSFYYNGLDKVNPKLGYTKSNVVTSCSECNYAKSDKSIEDFYRFIVRVYNNKKLGEFEDQDNA